MLAGFARNAIFADEHTPSFLDVRVAVDRKADLIAWIS
jgi:hypothetical protein